MVAHPGEHRIGDMTSLQGLMLRASIVLGMVAAVMTILYFTPMPDQSFKSCDRPCHALDWPMICRFKLNIEMYHTLSGICKDCPSNSTDCDNLYCPNFDGSTRGLITANRQLPGPAIHVCHNDILVIDVINKIPGHSLSVHWRGQSNKEAPFMDGVPMITQCPILSYTTFQYKFRASQPGTHYYHSFSDSDRFDGFFGAFIVKMADKVEPHRKLYDVDSKDHVVLLSEWSGDLASDFADNDDTPSSILINGKGPSDLPSTLSTYNVVKGKRYRFRVAYTSGTMSCPIKLTIDNHLVKVIALDGNSIRPYESSSIKLNKGERLDFVLKANQEIKSYMMRATSECKQNGIIGLASVNYEGFNRGKKAEGLGLSGGGVLNERDFTTAFCDAQLGKICVGDVASLSKIPKELTQDVDREIYLAFDAVPRKKQGDVHLDLQPKIYSINNITFTYPPSPILTQEYDVPLSSTCNQFKLPLKCENSTICECLHIEYLLLDSTVEIILINTDQEEDKIIHLHGYHFYIVASRKFDAAVTKEEIKELNKANQLFKRNFASPALKDTISIPRNTVVAIRFIANNPGFWMLRDEKSKGWTKGMDIVFQVGTYKTMVPTPTGFPTCGNFIGPDFFLI